jgi:hypothetical protein
VSLLLAFVLFDSYGNCVFPHWQLQQKSSISKDEIKTWDQEFVKVDQATLFDIILVLCQKTSFNYEFDCLIFFENWI